MPWGLIAIAAIQAGFAIYQQDQMMSAANSANAQAASSASANQAELVREQQTARREAQGAIQGTALGGAASRASKVSEQGTILTSSTQTRSLLGS